jgi:hypothetical protein
MPGHFGNVPEQCGVIGPVAERCEIEVGGEEGNVGEAPDDRLTELANGPGGVGGSLWVERRGGREGEDAGAVVDAAGGRRRIGDYFAGIFRGFGGLAQEGEAAGPLARREFPSALSRRRVSALRPSRVALPPGGSMPLGRALLTNAQSKVRPSAARGGALP